MMRDLRQHNAVIFEGDTWDDLPMVLREAADWIEDGESDAYVLHLTWDEKDPDGDPDVCGPSLQVFWSTDT